MKTYKTLTLGELIPELREIGSGKVRGLGAVIVSYRGYYERNAILKDDFECTGTELADAYERQIGKPIQGWKGGDYEVSSSENVYLVDSARYIGPNVCGLIDATGEGHFEPLLVDVTEW